MLTCHICSRAGRLERKQQHPKPQTQTCRSASTEDAYKTNVKPMVFMNFNGRLEPIGPAKFEAKCPWQNPYSHGYRVQKHKTSTAGPSRLWANGPANLKGYALIAAVPVSLAGDCWLVAAGCWLLLLAAGFWMLNWMLAAGCMLVVACCLLAAAGCWLRSSLVITQKVGITGEMTQA